MNGSPGATSVQCLLPAPGANMFRVMGTAPSHVRFDGRVLYLTDDPVLLRRQLEGDDLEWTPRLALRHDISTDEITPAHVCYYHDATLGDFAYLGLRCKDAFPVERGAVRAGGFAVSVSGRRRGKGSSREQSPYAEAMAGIRLVVAESMERIYRENCQNLGLLTSTDLTILGPIARGESIPLSRFTDGEGDITRAVIEHGGLLNFSRARLRGTARVAPVSTARRPMTLAEKIIARHWVADLAEDAIGTPYVRPGDEGFVRTDIRFSHEYVTPMAAMLWQEAAGPGARVADPDSVFFFRDHLTFLELAMTEDGKAMGLLDAALELKRKQEEFAAEQGITLYGEVPRHGGSGPRGAEAICHAMILERHALSGQVVVGSDSHTPHSGAIGCLAFGIGTTALCNAWLTRDVRLRVPPAVLVRVNGSKPANVTAKDVMLEILRHPYVKRGDVIGRMIEYAGDMMATLSLDERATMTNMAAELGAFAAIVPPDAVVADFLVTERGMTPEAAERLLDGLHSDPDAEYEAIIELEARDLRPMVALPGDPGNGCAVADLPARVAVDIAYAGSCTAGKKEDMDMYAHVFRAGLDAGVRVAPGVRCYVQFGSQEVKRYADARGYLEIFRAVGAEVLDPSCGACINAGPGVSYNRATVTVSAINRNFPGRSGPGQVYLASPYTVAASALAGYLTIWKA